MNRVLKVALICGVAATMASCGTVRRNLPFGLGGGKEDAGATASAGQRISVLEFEQSLSPSAALSGRDFFLPGPQAVTAWTQPGGTSENLVEHVIAAPNFQIAWKRGVGSGSAHVGNVMAPIVAADGKIFVLDGESTVSAVSADTGAILWKANVKNADRDRNGGFGGGVAVGGGKVFVSSGYRSMTALDANTGAVVWTQQVDAPIHGAPTVSGNRVFVVDVDSQLFAFDANTGAQDWTYRGIAEPARVMRASSPAVSGTTVVAPFASGQLVALSALNGQAVWEETLSRTSRTSALSEVRDVAGRPVISRGMVYGVSHSGVMSALDLRSGQPKWQLPVTGVNAPLPVGDAVFVVSKSGQLITANRDTGQIYWTRELNEGRERREGGFLTFGRRTIRPQWSGPLLASNRLVMVNSFGEAVAFDPKTGVAQTTLKLGAPAYIAPAAYNGALYVLTDNGQLICIR
ncbi:MULTISPECIES: PQQ-binding-like beta-propeller repeat protein [Brevundimonas]|jgi:outer membrane protein assembly factor BamB|uniref:Dehydrogenase n=2 Tax=Brevundimonas TaxID=41275 RepID=A0A1Z3U4S8_BREVE|nr:MULTISPECIES: PQQ-binding-like beta-propeller repeat protein [Brevundimonas]ASE38289.1 dehydrogenase [Brevundimonas vesicularis]MCW0046571.1 PQQ-like beta-propeller repeat protein [Brevundimonas sp. BT-123]MDQ1192400.1 outer membrane protein assembly factor BamB [Brevundimonas vesicularis]MDX2333627.1 PQQ-like beta-propeller repeat protein [Brevundimonas vesicularis]MRL68556.1 PQQ-binding-like beta-propeller repeat protein [Brevundimonas sp. SPF441]